ncbi:hypothetical protein [Rhodococcus aetherivorans]|uniref:hypothetical protein n=1 Tax=Rhodococcus aetherivorans TaxID=191292 RepID=UPI00388E4B9A
MTLTFTGDEAQHLASLLRIASGEETRANHPATVERAEKVIVEIVRGKVAEQEIIE